MASRSSRSRYEGTPSKASRPADQHSLTKSPIEEKLESMRKRRKQADERPRIPIRPDIPLVVPYDGLPTCCRCSSLIKRTYFTLEKPGGGTVDLCRKCARRVRVRLRMFRSKPNRGIRRILKSAMADLKEAKRLDPTNKQIQDNIEAVKSSLSVASGSSLRYACVWLPLWVIVGPWKYGFIPFIIVILWFVISH